MQNQIAEELVRLTGSQEMIAKKNIVQRGEFNRRCHLAPRRDLRLLDIAGPRNDRHDDRSRSNSHLSGDQLRVVIAPIQTYLIFPCDADPVRCEEANSPTDASDAKIATKNSSQHDKQLVVRADVLTHIAVSVVTPEHSDRFFGRASIRC